MSRESRALSRLRRRVSRRKDACGGARPPPPQPRLGELQREQPRTHVSRELELLRGDGEHLLDLGELPLVLVARQVLVKGLERELLALRLGEARLELGAFRLRLAPAGLRLG